MTVVQIVYSLIVALALVSMGVAQDAGKRLTMEEAVELAIKRNPEMLVALEDLAELKGKITEVRSGAYPQITFQGSRKSSKMLWSPAQITCSIWGLI
jgi:outer membrane protein TolC